MFPVEEKIGEIAAALEANRAVVLTAPPGSGKTTCVPPALLDAPWLRGRKIVMLEPRRLAARNCASYIARKRGEEVGGVVGYQVRLERRVSAKTRLEIVTEGLLAQRLLADPELADTGLVIFDEFHERSLPCDLAFALALDVRRALRPDLRILVMSATLDADEVAAHLARTLGDESGAAGLPPQRNVAVIRAEGRMFPVETKYLGDCPMTAAIGKALAETDGDVLCFLPGEGEIRRCLAACASFRSDVDVASPVDAVSHRVVRKVEVLPLYGSLPKEEQDKVFRQHDPLSSIRSPLSSIRSPLSSIHSPLSSIHSPQSSIRSPLSSIHSPLSSIHYPLSSIHYPPRKVVLATSIAETSVTLEGVTAVVDSGLMRVPRFSPGTGMTGLVTLPVTRDRAEQRRGRAGRVRAGICYRLWSETSDASRPAKSMPEILDADLASLVLSCASWGALAREDLPWMTPPPASAWDQARGLLAMLGALDARGQLTDAGRAMARLAMHPRLAAMCMGAWRSDEVAELRGGEVARWRSCEVNGCGMAALLAAIVEEGGKSRETDIRRILDEVRETPNRPDSRRILQLAKKFEGTGRSRSKVKVNDGFSSAVDLDLQTRPSSFSEGALLALAYPDRVAKNRGNATFQMVSGRGAFLDPSDALAKAPFLVCCELDDRAGDAKIFRCCPIDEDEIEELFAVKIVETPFCAWDRANERVKSVIRRKLGSLVLKEKTVTGKGSDPMPVSGDDVARALIDGVRQKGVANLPCWTKETLQLRARVAFLHRVLSGAAGMPPQQGSGSGVAGMPPQQGGESDWPALTDEEILGALPGFVGGMTKWRDLEKLDLTRVIESILANPQTSHSSLLTSHSLRELDRLAPTRMQVPSGSHMLIHYEGDEPTCEVRLQECFGLMETPKVAGGRVPVVMTLLSPAQRPVQVTKDLAGFWRGAYQLVRKDMRGRYPKHYWPEDPLTAVATRRVHGPR